MTIHMTVERETVVDTFVTLPFLLQAGNLSDLQVGEERRVWCTW